ncbi:hypothetical protein SBA4_20015 [Candidatus Sulfopaludibacter sp. SbA4]|nr:hypothetical protein SBA4_20015 [Candidatus Sulfopaludibacter sp. SbA4]
MVFRGTRFLSTGNPDLTAHELDRPIYRRRLLRFLFVFYRRGVVILHPLFKAVCYLELWHLLFIDRDSALRFTCGKLETRSTERQPPNNLVFGNRNRSSGRTAR